jgi:hypothetical protein
MLLEFLKAVHKQWISLLSGGAGVVLSGLSVFADVYGWPNQATRWFIMAACLCLVVACYSVWRQEREALYGLKRKIAGFPHIRLTGAEAFHHDRFEWAYPQPGTWSVLRLNLVNDPKVNCEDSFVPNLTATLTFYDDRGNKRFDVYGGRWEGTAQPTAARDQNIDITEIMAVPCNPGQSRTLNIVCKRLEDIASYAVSNDNYAHGLRNTAHSMLQGVYRCRVHLRGRNVDDHILLEFRNNGIGDLVPLRAYEVPKL